MATDTWFTGYPVSNLVPTTDKLVLTMTTWHLLRPKALCQASLKMTHLRQYRSSNMLGVG